MPGSLRVFFQRRHTESEGHFSNRNGKKDAGWVTTKADVEKWLGTPTGIEKSTTGDTWIYRLSNDETRVRPESFLPIVGGLVGGTDHKSEHRELKIKFNNKGIMESYKFDSLDKGGRT